MIFTLTQRLSADTDLAVNFTLSLTAEERTRSRYRFQTDDDHVLFLHLSRGTILDDGEIIQSENSEVLVRILAKPEPVLTVTANTNLDLLRAAYHLGNRHVPLEITSSYLRLSADPVLKTMLENLGVQVTEEILPFQPEMGAYHHGHSH